jgi:hypothetical protein
MSADPDALTRACLRVYRRYAVEVVEALGFCPYAERCRVESHTREVVVLDDRPDPARALAEVEALVPDDGVEVALLIWPRLPLDRARFSRFVQDVRAAHQARAGGLVFAMEGFHPEALPDLETPERLIPFVRRTPDPTIQLVRHSVLTHVRRGTPQGTAFFDPTMLDLEALLREPVRAPLHERIAGTNHATVLALGADAVQARLDDILADRDRTYRGLGEPERDPKEDLP